MKEYDNSKLHISNNFILSVCLHIRCNQHPHDIKQYILYKHMAQHFHENNSQCSMYFTKDTRFLMVWLGYRSKKGPAQCIDCVSCQRDKVRRKARRPHISENRKRLTSDKSIYVISMYINLRDFFPTCITLQPKYPVCIYTIVVGQSPVMNVSRYIVSVESAGKASLNSNVCYTLQTLIFGRIMLKFLSDLSYPARSR